MQTRLPQCRKYATHGRVSRGQTLLGPSIRLHHKRYRSPTRGPTIQDRSDRIKHVDARRAGTHRSMCVHSPRLWGLLSSVHTSGDSWDDLEVHAWSDADFNTPKSITGFFLALVVPNGSQYPISWGAARQQITTTRNCNAIKVRRSCCVNWLWSLHEFDSPIISPPKFLQELLKNLEK